MLGQAAVSTAKSRHDTDTVVYWFPTSFAAKNERSAIVTAVAWNNLLRRKGWLVLVPLHEAPGISVAARQLAVLQH